MAIEDLLNQEQIEAVKHKDGPLLILAGAGSGKTRVITYRIAYLMSKCNVPGANILAVTFTNKAAQEMKDRIRSVIGKHADTVWMSTFHAMGVRILRRYAEKIGYTNNFTIYDQSDRERLIKECMHDVKVSDKDMKPYEILKRLQGAKNELITPEQYRKDNDPNNFESMIVAKVYELYEKRIKANNSMDFDDLIAKPIELFINHPDVLEKYREQFKYIMIDEYQDINNSQYTLISMIASKYKNIGVVGDDDQSIYRFRGADITNILNFEEDYPNAKVIRLEQNYRSTKTILKAAHSVIKNNQDRKVKELWTDNPEGEKIQFYSTDDEQHEAETILNQVGKIMTDADLKEIAVFYRTNAQSRVIEDKFRRAAIPYKLVGGLKFYDRMEVKDMLAYMRIISNPKDIISLKRIINVPPRGLGDVSLQKIEKFAFEHSLDYVEALGRADEVEDLRPAVADTAKKFYSLIKRLDSYKNSVSLKEVLRELLTETGYIEYWQSDSTSKAKERVENIQELVSAIVEYEESKEDSSLEDFLNQVALVSDTDKLDESKNAVTLMTVHSAKGLEFDYAFMAGMEEGRFPHSNSIDEEGGIEEERRLCYVGITRARKKLFMLCASSRRQFGIKSHGKVSRFIEEIPEELLERKGRMPMRIVEEKLSGKTRDNEQYLIDNVPDYSAVDDAPQINNRPGDKVKHHKLGMGTIVNIEPYGDDYKITVAFKSHGKKTLSAKYAGLEKV